MDASECGKLEDGVSVVDHGQRHGESRRPIANVYQRVVTKDYVSLLLRSLVDQDS